MFWPMKRRQWWVKDFTSQGMTIHVPFASASGVPDRRSSSRLCLDWNDMDESQHLTHELCCFKPEIVGLFAIAALPGLF